MNANLYWVKVMLYIAYKRTEIEFVKEGPSAEWVGTQALLAQLNVECVQVTPITAPQHDHFVFTAGEGAEDLG